MNKILALLAIFAVAAIANTISTEPEPTTSPYELTYLSGLKDQVSKLKSVVSEQSFPRLPRATKEHTALLNELSTMMKEMNKNIRVQNLFDNKMSAEEKDFVRRQHKKQIKTKKLLARMEDLSNNTAISPEEFHEKKEEYINEMEALISE